MAITIRRRKTLQISIILIYFSGTYIIVMTTSLNTFPSNLFMAFTKMYQKFRMQKHICNGSVTSRNYFMIFTNAYELKTHKLKLYIRIYNINELNT